MEAYYGYHELLIPKAISTTLLRCSNNEIEVVVNQLQKEISIMNNHLKKYYSCNDIFRQHYSLELECSLVDVETESIKDYSDNDTNFVKYLPFYLPKCC